MIMLVLLCQTLVYKEVTALFELRDGESEISPLPGVTNPQPARRRLAKMTSGAKL